MTAVAHRRSRRDRNVDVACVTIAVLVGVVAALDTDATGRAPRGYIAQSLAVTAVACVLIWWRRRRPVAVALILLPPAIFTEFVGGATLIAVFTVAVHRRWYVAFAVTVLHLLASVPYSILQPDPTLTIVEYHGINVVLLSAVVAWGMMVRARRELVASLHERAVRAAAEATQRAERLRGLERERIAREMHDVLAHRISLVSLHAGALEVRPDMSAEQVARTAGTIRASAHQALEDLREILDVLRAGDDGAGVRPQTGLSDLDELIVESRATGTTVHLDDRLPDVGSLPASVSRTAYRIVQEGLTNARKHAPDAEVWVRIERQADGELHVWLRNRLAAGPVQATIPGSRSGLVGLAERVSLVGGRIDHGARRGAGGTIDFHLEAWLPWPS